MTTTPLSIRPALQSIVNGTTGQVIGYEVLSRWTDGIFALEPYKTTPNWVQADKEIIHALSQGAGHITQLEERFFINVSQETLGDDAHFDYWHKRLLDFLWLVNLPITIEIVEDVDDETLQHRWRELESLGVTFALDDFGKKHSTLERLQRYEWSFCKFDIQDQILSPEALDFCDDNAISIIAERVESEHWSQKAFKHGLNQHQGFLYGLPFFLREDSSDASVD